MTAKDDAYLLLLNETAWQEMVHAIQYTRAPDSTAHRRGGYSPRDSAVFLAQQALSEKGIHTTETAIRLAMRKIDA